MTTSVASKRLFQEYKHLTQDPPDGITAGPVEEDDLFVWEALIEGPEGTPYEGGIFPAELKFPKDYPLMPPTMKFLSDIWHPNGMLHPHSSLHLLLSSTRLYTNRKLQYIQTASSVSLSSTLPATTPITTNTPQSAGARSRVWKRS
jgi:ubiquitin-protein ligase